MKIKGIIFDFGFTLFQFIDVSVERYFDCFRRGLKLSIKKLKEERVMRDRQTIEQFIKQFNKKRASYFRKSIKTKKEFPTSLIFEEVSEMLNLKKLKKAVYAELADLFHSIEETEWIPFENTRPTLEELSKNNDIKLAVLSNHPNHSTIIKLIQKHDLMDFFETIITSAQYGRRKPHPDIFHHTLKEMGLDISDSAFCLVCGDEYADIVGGRKAGLKTILYERVFKFPFEKQIEQQDYIKIKDISEILDFVP